MTLAGTGLKILACDLSSGGVLDELPIDQGTFTCALSSPGAFTCEMPAGAVPSIQTCTTPNVNAIFVDYLGTLVYGGIVRQRAYDSQTKKLQLQGTEHIGLLSQRLLRVSKTYSNLDQITGVAVDLLHNYFQDLPPGAGFPFGLTSSGPSGVLITDAHAASELKQLSALFDQYANSEPGFEYAQDNVYTTAPGGGPACSLNFDLQYPHRGLSQADSPWAFDLGFGPGPGNILRYQLHEDGTKQMNAVFAKGSSTNVGGFTAPQSVGGLNFPLLEGVVSYTDVADQTLLNSLAEAHAALYFAPPFTFTLSVPPGGDPLLGQYKVGDNCQVFVLDERFNVPLKVPQRIMSYTITYNVTGTPALFVDVLTGPPF